MESQQSIPVNPLINFMRQPKIYIQLPSGGKYWPAGSLEISETGEYPVYSMTAKDELLLKIPDALMNGQAVVDVIQHCMPNIKNAWGVPSTDIDAILIAIRLATYGEKMTMPVSFADGIEMEYSVDLRIVLDNIMQNAYWDPIVPINNDLTVYVKPIDYKILSKVAVQTFETQKIMQAVNDEKLSEDDKVKIFKESFKKLTEVTVGTISASIFKIDSAAGSTENSSYIRDFIDNADKEIFNKIQIHIDKMKELNTLKPMIIETTEEMREKGITSNTVEIPLMFDPTTFFG
jgi:hypothetical protein